MDQRGSKKKGKRKRKEKGRDIIPPPKPKAKDEEKEGSNRKWYFLLAVIIVISLLSYLNCLNNQYVFDDKPLILENPTIRGIEKIPRLLGIGKRMVSYRPLRTVSYAVDYTLNKKLWRHLGSYEGDDEGINPLGYHLSNIIYHLVTSFLVFLVVYRLAASWRVAFLAASLFALHPVHTDSVTYLSGRRDILFTLFYLAGFYFFLRYRQSNKLMFIIASFLAYLLSLASKEMAVTLPAVFLCYDFTKDFTVRGGEINLTYFKGVLLSLKKAILQSKYVYVLTFLGALAYTYYKVLIKSPSHQSYYYGGSALTTFLTVGKILVYYLKLLLYPLRLNADYSYNAFPLSTSFFEPATFFAFIVLVAVGYVVLRLLASYKLLAFGSIWFFVTLLPVCHIFPHHELLAEHYLYLPSFGFCLIVAFLFDSFLKERKYLYLIYLSLIAMVFLFSLRIVDRNRDWQDRVTFWEKTVKTAPQCARAHANLCAAYTGKGRLQEAMFECKRALIINPNHAEAHTNLGVVYAKKGRLDEAIPEYKRAIAIRHRYKEAYYNLGVAYLRKRRFNEAIAEFERAIAIRRHYAEAHNNLGIAYAKKGNLDKAIYEYRRALALKRRYAEAYNNLGIVYAKKGRIDEAISQYERAITIKPLYVEAHINLGVVYHKKGRFAKAIAEYKRALEVKANLAGVHGNLAMAYFKEKQYALAIKHCDKATELGYKVSPTLLRDLLPYR